MKDLTPEMEKRVKIHDLALKNLLKAYPSNQSTASLYTALSSMFTEAMHSIRKEAQLELIEEMKDGLVKEKPISALGFRLEGEALETYMRYRGYNEARAEIKDILTTKEKSIKEELK